MMDWNPASPGSSEDRPIIDDRLATVLRAPVTGDASARTQLRQLVDLLGSIASSTGDAPQLAYDRLEALLNRIPSAHIAAILAEPGLRLRNARLVARLADSVPPVAAAAMAAARLEEPEWIALIPRLPIVARGLLRHRRDLPAGAQAILQRLGVRDLVLAAPAEERGKESIGALRQKIDAFRSAREKAEDTPRLPMAEKQSDEPDPGRAFDFLTDAEGAIIWAQDAIAPCAIGIDLGVDDPSALAVMDRSHIAAMRHRQPLRRAPVRIDAAPAISGEWSMDAMPRFDGEGHFTGYSGRMRRVAPAQAQDAAASTAEADRIRQLLHELRTPVNAIQGFAEVIQQQVFGPAPNEYRALAAAVAVDAARLMAGFDELERLTRLELHALTLGSGSTDLRRCIGDTLRRLEGAMRPRSARMTLNVAGTAFHVGLDESEAAQLVWRFLATLSGALGAGEESDMSLESDGRQIALKARLPASLDKESDIFAATAPVRSQTLSAGAFGSGFALRLARAEAVTAGGALHRTDDFVELVLPALTDPDSGDAANERDANTGGGVSG